MAEREDNVYKAKLAEQAERYDGKWLPKGFYFVDFELDTGVQLQWGKLNGRNERGDLPLPDV